MVIEVDGEAHFTEEGLEYDRIRDRYLASLGYKVLRIPAYEVIRDGSGVVLKIREFVQSSM